MNERQTWSALGQVTQRILGSATWPGIGSLQPQHTWSIGMHWLRHMNSEYSLSNHSIVWTKVNVVSVLNCKFLAPQNKQSQANAWGVRQYRLSIDYIRSIGDISTAARSVANAGGATERAIGGITYWPSGAICIVKRSVIDRPFVC